jgi:hypothetical protein
VSELPPQWRVWLSCGHVGVVMAKPKVGTWVSCWAVVAKAGGGPSCQAQRKIVGVEEPLA